MNERQKVLANHIANDLQNLILLESEQNELLKKSIEKLEAEILQEAKNRVSIFKKRSILLFVLTIVFWLFCAALVKQTELNYSTPEFYLIVVGSLVWLYFLRLHFSVKLNYSPDVFFNFVDIHAKQVDSINILHDIKNDLDKINLNK